MPNVIEIADFSAPELDIYARLTENQLVNRAHPEDALFIAESPVVIGRALDAGCVPVSFLMETKHVEGKGRALIARCGGYTRVRRAAGGADRADGVSSHARHALRDAPPAPSPGG